MRRRIGSTASAGRSIIRQVMAAMRNQFESPLKVLASVTHTSAEYREDLDGPDSHVGLDYWYRHRGTGKEAYLNRDQDHLTVSIAGQRIYDAEIPTEAELAEFNPSPISVAQTNRGLLMPQHRNPVSLIWALARSQRTAALQS